MEDPKVGLIINNRYRLVQYLGQGSFGEVWMARDTITGVDVAIKLYLSLDEKGREEFLSEYKVAYGLKHPNLVVTEVYDTWESRPFLVMKFCSRGSSSKVIGNLTPNYGDERFIWQFIHDVSAGLAYLHNQTPDPVVHQDIKPDNILVDENGSFLISDFGISKRIRSTMRAQSSRALQAGATAYMGPERFTKNPAPITASDIWSLGASIYELAEGELPFAGLGGVFLKNGGEMAELSNGWTVELNKTMQKCLAREPWDRWKAFELEEYTRNILAKFDVWYRMASKIGMAGPEVKPQDNPRGTQRITNTDNPFTSSNDIGKRQPPVSPEPPKEETTKQEKETGNEKKPATTPDTSTTKSGVKTYLIAAIVLAVIVGGVLYFMNNGKPSEAALTAYSEEYIPAVDSCKYNIANGDQAKYEKLVKARKFLATIDSLENLYKGEMEEEFNNAQALRSQLDEKAIPAAKAWAESAKTQVRDLDNKERALEYYRVSYSIYEDPEVKQAMELLKK